MTPYGCGQGTWVEWLLTQTVTGLDAFVHVGLVLLIVLL